MRDPAEFPIFEIITAAIILFGLYWLSGGMQA